MKRLLVPLVLCLLVAAVSATNLNFQNPTDNNSVLFGNNTEAGTFGSVGWAESTTALNNYYYMGIADSHRWIWITRTQPYATTYSAATLATSNAASSYCKIQTVLLDQNRNILGSNQWTMYPASYPHRYEVKINGGHSYYFCDGALIATGPYIATTPSYIGWGVAHEAGGGTNPCGSGWDDYVYGSTENKYVLGLPESDGDKFIILDDIVNSANDGVYNTTSNTQTNANYMYGTWSRGNASIDIDTQPNESVQLVNYGTGVVYATNYTGAGYFGTVAIDIKTLLIDVNAPDGYYALTIPGTGAYSNPILKRSSGATVTWNSDVYSSGDTAAVITYVTAGGYWDPGTYTYKLAVMDVFGQFHGVNQTINTQSGSFTHAWGEDDDPGVYYAIVYATTNSGAQYILGSDWTELTSDVNFNGLVVNAQTGANITGAVVNFTQGSTIVNFTTLADGAYTASGFSTGAVLWTNVTATGYRPYNYSFTPMTAKGIRLDFSLVPDPPAYTGLGIGGVDRDTVYGRPIAGASVTVRNTTTGEYYVKTTSATGWYLCDDGSTCMLQTKTPYSVWGYKIGYLNSSTYSAVTE